MPLIWTPDTQTPLILSQEHEVGITASISVDAEPNQQPVESLLWTMPDGAPKHMRVLTVKNTLNIEIDNWIGLFPIEINTMQDDEPMDTPVQTPAKVTNWDDVPAAQADVYAFIPDSRNVRHFRLIVEAYGAGNMLMETATYTITVYANYDVGCKALKAAVQNRKESSSCQP